MHYAKAPVHAGQEALIADDPRNSGPANAQRINVNEEHELRYWTEALSVDEQTLREAVRNAGVMAVDVRRVLGKQ